MNESIILWLRDPHAFLREEIIILWLEQENDGPLLDKVDALTRRQALLIYHTIMMVRAWEQEMNPISIIDLIKNSNEEFILVGNTTLQ